MVYLDKPDLIGPGFAVAFVSTFYGFLFELVALTLGDAVTGKLIEQTVTLVPSTLTTGI